MWGPKAKTYFSQGCRPPGSWGSVSIPESGGGPPEDQVIALVETRVPEDKDKDLVKWWRRRGRETVTTPARRTGTKETETSGGALISYRKEVEAEPLKLKAHKPEDWAGIWLNLRGVPLVVITIYLRNGEGPRGPTNVKRLLELKEVLACLPVPWFMVGDWNFEPCDLEEAGWDGYFDAVVLKPEACEATCTSGKGRLLDYVLAGNGAEAIIASVKAVRDVPWGPHFGIRVT